MRRSIVWVPVLLLGSVLYWSVALGLGGLSLALLGSSDEALPAVDPPHGDDAIVVRLASPDEFRSNMPVIRPAREDIDRLIVAPPEPIPGEPGPTAW